MGEESPILVLGGGVCGLSAALDLARRGVDVLVLEREEQPGGLAAGHRRGENFYDLGVHMLHAFDSEVFEIAKEAMGEERIEVELDARIRWAGDTYRYPLQFGDMVRGMNPIVLARCVAGLFTAKLLGKIHSAREIETAEEALIDLYGGALYRFFFEGFTERYWGIHPSGLSAAFVRSKMPRLSAVDILKRQLARFGIREKGDRAVESALLQETLHYSRNGAEALPRRLAATVEEAGGEIRLGATVERILLDAEGLATGVQVKGDAVPTPCSGILSTLPITALAQSLDPAPPREVREAVGNLRYKPIAIYGLLVAKARALDALYVYFRDRVFHRVGEPKNAGLEVSPPDHTVLIVETTCEEGDPVWRGDEAHLERILTDLEAEGVCRREEVVETHVLTYATGYPIFDLGFESHLGCIEEHLGTIPNLLSTGRQGGFCYPNMHQAMRMGMTASKEISPC